MFLGRANQGALIIPEKSTSPIAIATMYPKAMPPTTGRSLNSPRARVRTHIDVTREMIANNQLLFDISTAVPERDKPIRMMTGPTTTGGNRRLRKSVPRHLISAEAIKYTNATPANPDRVPSSPHCLEAKRIGAMKAKLDPRKMGTFPRVTR